MVLLCPPNGEDLRDASLEEKEAIWLSRYDAVTAEEEEEEEEA